jgi:hypothetical protein
MSTNASYGPPVCEKCQQGQDKDPPPTSNENPDLTNSYETAACPETCDGCSSSYLVTIHAACFDDEGGLLCEVDWQTSTDVFEQHCVDFGGEEVCYCLWISDAWPSHLGPAVLRCTELYEGEWGHYYWQVLAGCFHDFQPPVVGYTASFLYPREEGVPCPPSGSYEMKYSASCYGSGMCYVESL